MRSQDLTYETILRTHGYRVTEGRVSLLSFLAKAKSPLTVSQILKGLHGTLDKVTLYRALVDFSHKKIITKVNLQDTLTRYEFLHANHHHHHIICERCGKIEDIEHCEQPHLEKSILKHSKTFSAITSHSLEFFGICKKCR